MPDELPGVTVPSLTNTGRSRARLSSVVLGLGCSSTRNGSSLGRSTPTICSSNCPSLMAMAVRYWLSAANRSCSRRLTL